LGPLHDKISFAIVSLCVLESLNVKA